MITIFTIPKPFHGHNNIIQRNAVQSWLQLTPTPEVILFGDDDGVAETAHEFDIKHIPDVEKNEFGTPLLSSAFSTAQQTGRHDLLMYANADVIFFQDLVEAVSHINKPSFLLCGRRWDLDITEEIDFANNGWAKKLLDDVKNNGVLHGLSGMDYFVFPRNTVHMPPFAVGRVGWDTWLIFNMRSRKIPVVNATEAITVLHQNHDYSHSEFGKKKYVAGPELQKNIEIAGGLTHLMTLRDADWILTNNGLRRPSLPRRIYSLLSVCYPWRLLLAMKRKIQKWL